MKNNIGIVIANWNGGVKLQKCVEYLSKQTCKAFQVVVVDNGSDDESEFVAKKLIGANCKIIKLKTNCGYTTAMNMGISSLATDYILLLNNDAYLKDPEFLNKAIVKLTNQPKDVVGVFPTVVFEWDEHTINAGRAIWHNKFMWYEPEIGIDISQLAKTDQQVFGSLFIAPIIRKNLWDKLGGFNEIYFSYGEDFDICYRAATKGLKFLMTSHLIVNHDHRSSSNEKSDPLWSFYLFQRNYLLVVLINYQLKNIFMSVIDYSRYYRSALYNALFSLDYDKTKVLIKVFLSLLRLSPLIYRSRKNIQRQRTVDDRDFWSSSFALEFNPHYNYNLVQISALSTIGDFDHDKEI